MMTLVGPLGRAPTSHSKFRRPCARVFNTPFILKTYMHSTKNTTTTRTADNRPHMHSTLAHAEDGESLRFPHIQNPSTTSAFVHYVSVIWLF